MPEKKMGSWHSKTTLPVCGQGLVVRGRAYGGLQGFAESLIWPLESPCLRSSFEASS